MSGDLSLAKSHALDAAAEELDSALAFPKPGEEVELRARAIRHAIGEVYRVAVQDALEQTIYVWSAGNRRGP